MPEGALGFIYCIHNLKTGKKYIGKKMAWSTKTSVKTITTKAGVKKKKKTKTQVPSDWKTYWSSSPNLIVDTELFGKENFKREILFYCSSKGSMNYYEARLQMDNRVLENPDLWYNGIINCRVHHSHIKPIL